MNRQFDFRALILNIQDRLSNDDRRRLHFVVGDIIPRMQRDDVTLGGTLTLLESLFDRAEISEDDFDLLIRLFSEIHCHEAVKRLKAYQLKKQPPRERQLTMTDLFDDNIENDKLMSMEPSSLPSDRLDQRKPTKSDSPSPPYEPFDTIDKPSITITPSRRIFTTSTVLFCLYIAFILQILALFIYLGLFFHKKTSAVIIKNRAHSDVYILRPGYSPGNLSGQPFDHSRNLSLTFADRLTRIDMQVEDDHMYSIKFTYSQNKTIEHRLKKSPRPNLLYTKVLDLQKQNLDRITQYYRDPDGPKRLVGLRFGLKNQSAPLFGSSDAPVTLKDEFFNLSFGYVTGSANEFLNGFHFIWYIICSTDQRVLPSVNLDGNKDYTLLDADVYKD